MSVEQRTVMITGADGHLEPSGAALPVTGLS